MICQSQCQRVQRSWFRRGSVSVVCSYPYMPKDRTVGALAVSVMVLRYDGRYGHRNANKAVVVDTDPQDVEPGQTAFWHPPYPSLSTTALGKPVDRHDPRLDGMQLPEENFLAMQVGGHIMAQECEEGGDGEGLVTIGYYLEVDGMPVPLELQVGRDGVYWDHEQDANDTVQNQHSLGTICFATSAQPRLTIVVRGAVCS